MVDIQNKNPGTIILSAGGTGGHLFPAEALAKELLTRGHRVIIVTDARGHAFKSLGNQVAVHCVRAATLRSGIMGKIKAIVAMAVGILQAGRLLLRYKPCVVVGFGGYPSFPAVFAAQLLFIPTVLHEQNAVLGKANAALAGRAKGIAMSLPQTRGIGNMDKAEFTGNPVRPEIVAMRDFIYEPPVDDMRILITGGSQAAHVFTRVVPVAVGQLSENMRKRIVIMHQARAEDLENTKKMYKEAGVRAEVETFFTDMPARLKGCHLFIGRGGASSVAEAAVAGRPGIFVPHPGHADMQQKHNADIIASKGGGWCMLEDSFTPEHLAQTLQGLMEDPAQLKEMAAIARTCGQPDAVHQLAQFVEKRMT